MRFEVVLLDQVRRHRLDPVRLDLRHHAREQLGGLHQFGSHDPLRALARQRAGRVDPEAPLAGAEVVALLGLLADLAEQAGEDRLVHRRIVLQRLRHLLALALGGHRLAGALVQLAADLGAGRRLGGALRRLGLVQRQLEVAAGQQQLAVGVAPLAQS
ncbi:hypothetical protein D3C75_965940 [compost metagenome]